MNLEQLQRDVENTRTESVWRNGELVARLGYEEDGREILTQTSVKCLEGYLLRWRTTSFQRLITKVLGINLCIGIFRPAGETTGHMKYYLYWHRRCKSFVVTHVHGYSRLPCGFCTDNRHFSKKELRNLAKYKFNNIERAIFKFN